MANWDNADLLARFKEVTLRPAVDEELTDAAIYKLLGDGQLYWYQLFSVHFPWLLYTAPTKMLTADNGLTYTFPNGVTPMKAEIRESLGGRKLVPGAEWSAGSDYVWEGNKIRFPLGASRTFSDGPYSRYVVPPGIIDGATQPTLTPDYARQLIPLRAAIIWAGRGGLRDPKPYKDEEDEIWYGEPARGKIGMLAMLKTQNPDLGAGAIRRGGAPGQSYLGPGSSWLWNGDLGFGGGGYFG